ncbi:MAG: CoB--CoM heterodisulfide reductase iron-sulfur subunit A family protein [Alistipes sp.]|nr:CoB--CoM heterodisulfide reductase iron-sulfur subunit A family protein [Alistipes sp.]
MRARKVVIIGGGVAGMQTALRLRALGEEPIIIEREAQLGGKVRNWYLLFPTFIPSADVVEPLMRAVKEQGIEVHLGCEVVQFDNHRVELADGERIDCDAVALCSGSTIFDARLKEEYGYGIYDNVYTSVDIERMMAEGRMPERSPRRVAILHCVGSRDEKVCQRHCSKVCCITGVKQAIELKKLYPKADVFNFYMDIRMFGPGYEELYHTAQRNYNVHFVRGRISEASPLMDGCIQIKAEDTLTGRPLRMSVDMLILLVGMRANDDNVRFAESAGLRLADSGFMRAADLFAGNVRSSREGIFYAGTITAPKSIGEVLNEGVVVADSIVDYLNKQEG